MEVHIQLQEVQFFFYISEAFNYILWTGPQSGWVGKGQFTKFYCYDEWQPPEKKFKWEVGKMAVGVHKQ